MAGNSFSDQITVLSSFLGIGVSLGVVATTVIDAHHLYHGSSDSLNGLVAITLVALAGLVMVILGLWWRNSFFGLWNPGKNKRAIIALSTGIALDAIAAAGIILAFVYT